MMPPVAGFFPDSHPGHWLEVACERLEAKFEVFPPMAGNDPA
jgi:hypothetical protein